MVVKVRNKYAANLPASSPLSSASDREEKVEVETEEEEEEEDEESTNDERGGGGGEEEEEGTSSDSSNTNSTTSSNSGSTSSDSSSTSSDEEEEEENEHGPQRNQGQIEQEQKQEQQYFSSAADQSLAVLMENSGAAAPAVGSPPESSEGLFQFDPTAMASIIKRKAMIKELSACYRAECISHIQELLELQSRWKEQLDNSNGLLQGAESSSGRNQNVTLDVTPIPPQKSKQTSSTVSVSNEEAASGEVLENSTNASQTPLRRHLVWRSNERDALRRALLMFGLGRSEKVRNSMASQLKKMRHGLGDIADSCWEFVRICGLHVNESERMLAERLYEKSRDLDIEHGQEVSSRIGMFDRVDKSASGWLKRLILLDNLGNVIRLCASKETQEAAYSAIDNLKDGTSPFEWWGREADLALLSGVYKHGFANYEALQADPQFAAAFHPLSQRKLRRPSIEADNFQHSHEFGDSQFKDRFHSEDDYENADSREGSDFTWPEANTLTRRLKRLIEHISRIEKEFDVTGKHIKEKPTRVWTKKEKMELLKILMTWGRPLAMGDDENNHWKTVKSQAKIGLLKTRNSSSIEAGIRSLESDMRQILDNSDNAEAKEHGRDLELSSVISGPKVLSYKTATRLKERLELLDTLRQAIDSLPEDWGQLNSILNQRNNMPPWWRVCHDDKDLVKGVLKHGCGNWDVIFGDEALFRTKDTSPHMANLPDPKTCMKRLRFIGCHLRRYLRKLKGRRKRQFFDDKENEAANESRRFKRVRSVEIPRGPDGKPILPLVLTERLTVINLGTIEYRRPSFHTDRHVFPIGYTAQRNYASMVAKDKRTNYTCQVLDHGGPGPVFRVTPEDSPGTIIEKDSASGAWAVVCTEGNKVRGVNRGKITISGTEMFGLSHPVIIQLLSELPGAEYCSTFADHPNVGSQRQIKKPVVHPAIQDTAQSRDIEMKERADYGDETEQSSSDTSEETESSESSYAMDIAYQSRITEDQNFSSRKQSIHSGSRERTHFDMNAEPEYSGSP